MMKQAMAIAVQMGNAYLIRMNRNAILKSTIKDRTTQKESKLNQQQQQIKVLQVRNMRQEKSQLQRDEMDEKYCLVSFLESSQTVVAETCHDG